MNGAYSWNHSTYRVQYGHWTKYNVHLVAIKISVPDPVRQALYPAFGSVSVNTEKAPKIILHVVYKFTSSMKNISSLKIKQIKQF